MHLATIALACAVTAQVQTPAEPRHTRAPETDQTVSVSRGTRLVIDNYAGEVEIHAWDKDAIRVQARHNARVKIDIRHDANMVSIGTGSTKSSGSIDYEIMAPAWMPMKIEGHFNFVTIEAVQAEIAVTTVRGDIVLKNIGSATVKTVEGAIELDRARGRVSLNSVNEDIKVSGASGEFVAETTNGNISVTRMESTSVEVTTVSGDIEYEGSLADKGHYTFTSHSGDVKLTIPASASATFSVRTYSGEFSSSLPVKGPNPSEVRQGRRVTYTLGNGSADVEMESFAGDIVLRRAGGNRSSR
jgi:DUF4097 and DUF4098 domain-containing protein YvlB